MAFLTGCIKKHFIRHNCKTTVSIYYWHINYEFRTWWTLVETAPCDLSHYWQQRQMTSPILDWLSSAASHQTSSIVLGGFFPPRGTLVDRLLSQGLELHWLQILTLPFVWGQGQRDYLHYHRLFLWRISSGRTRSPKYKEDIFFKCYR